MTEEDKILATRMRDLGQPTKALFVEEGYNELLTRVVTRAEAEGLKPADVADAIIDSAAVSLFSLLKDDADIIEFAAHAGDKLTTALVMIDFGAFIAGVKE